MSQPSVGAATQAVLDSHQRALAQHRRRTLADRAVTVALATWTVIAVLVIPIIAASRGGTSPWFLSVSPVPLLVIWWLLRRSMRDALGSRGEPRLSSAALEHAAQADADAAAPRAFGALPEGMRVYRPEHR